MKIKGTGSYVPPNVVSNKEISMSPNWVYEKLGIKERRISDMTTSHMATIAGLNAIKSANITIQDIDLIIVATSTPDKLAPSVACMVQDNIGAINAAAFDVNAVCSGFVYALSLASELPYKNILVIGVDRFSTITDWNSRDNIFFGDGAGAAVVSGRACYFIGADGYGRESFKCDHGCTFKMVGKDVYSAGLHYLPIAINSVLEKRGITIDEIDWMLPHQASKRMLEELAVSIGIPFSKVLTNMEKYGNTAAASIPILLDEGKFKNGDLLLLASIGSGWTYGAIIIRW